MLPLVIFKIGFYYLFKLLAAQLVSALSVTILVQFSYHLTVLLNPLLLYSLLIERNVSP